MKTSGHIILFTLVVITSLLVAFLGVHVILSIANLYSLHFITQFSFVQVYGALMILGVLKYRYEKQSTKDSENPYANAFLKAFSMAIYYLLAWGMSFLMFSILT